MNSKQIFSQGRSFYQKMGALNNLRATVVSTSLNPSVTGTLSVVFLDTTTNKTKDWALPATTNNCVNACCVLLPGILIVAFRSNSTKITIQEYTLPQDVFSSAPAVGQSYTFGDSETRDFELLVLPSNEVLCMTNTFRGIAFQVAVRSLSGSWEFQGTLNIAPEAGPQTSHQFSVAVAPWDGSIWAGNFTDGAGGSTKKGLDVGIFKVINGQVTIQKIILGFLSLENSNGNYVMGTMAPNGEIPGVTFVSDYTRNQLLIATTSHEGTLTNGFNTPYPMLVGVKSDGKPYLIMRANQTVGANVNPQFIHSDSNQLSWWTAGTAVPPNELQGTFGRVLCRSGVAFDTFKQLFIVGLEDGSVSLITESISTPVPLPIPTPIPQPETAPIPVPVNTPPTVSFVSILLTLHAYASDRQDGNLNEKIVWTSDAVTGPIGKGSSVMVTLPRKNQKVTASVTDKNGVTASDSFSISFTKT